ncbi:FtsW/RodA/SpoVE family cell cycle protein [Pelosinus sp. sgz500959]|uniref:FtsW/RodA/SpoVE family cell cycle protein n=1 Tax=Pelosinus sp. sgz500959 TaxID=3242472 RepID=UPI003671B87F
MRFWMSNMEAILYTTLLLFMIGTVNIFSASFVESGQTMHDSYYYLKRHMMMFGIGMIALFIMSRIDYRKLKKLISLLMILTIGLLVAVHTHGIMINGAKRWVNLGFQFQPSELAKLTGLMITAGYLGPIIDYGRRVTLLSTPFYVTVILAGIVYKQPDMGTAVIIIGVCLMLYLIAGLPKQQLFVLLGGGSLLFIYAALTATYRAERIYAWLNPWAYREGIGYQSVQGLLAIGSGGFFGTGLGMGASKFYYLPEGHTDFAFAVLCQEMGFFGVIIILFLLSTFAYYGIRIALKAPDGFGKMLAIGTVILIVGQAIINMAMVSGLIPVVGVPLPFISFGGTALIVNLTAIGILINVGRQAAIFVPGESQSAPDNSRNTRLKLARQARTLSRVK